MDRQPLNSSWLISSGHDPKTNTMHLEIKDGRPGKPATQVLVYENVPAEKHEALRAAESAGNFFHTLIKPFHVGKPLLKQNQADGDLKWEELQKSRPIPIEMIR